MSLIWNQPSLPSGQICFGTLPSQRTSPNRISPQIWFFTNNWMEPFSEIWLEGFLPTRPGALIPTFFKDKKGSLKCKIYTKIISGEVVFSFGSPNVVRWQNHNVFRRSLKRAPLPGFHSGQQVLPNAHLCPWLIDNLKESVLLVRNGCSYLTPKP